MEHQVKQRKISLITQITIIFWVSLALANIIVLFVSKNFFLMESVEQSTEIAKTALAGVAEIIYDDLPDLNFNFDDDKEFLDKLNDSIKSLCQKTSLSHIYLYRIDDEGVVHYITCAGSDDEHHQKLNEVYGYGNTRKRDLYKSEEAILSGDTDINYEFINNEFGNVCMWLSPIVDENGDIKAFIGANYSMDYITRLQYKNYYIVLIVGLISIFITFAIALVLIKANAIRPIKVLSEKMRRFAENQEEVIDEERNVIENRKRHIKDEVTDIEDSFYKMTKDIKKYISDISHLTTEKVQVKTQMDIARKIQCGIVPERKSFNKGNYEISGYTHPAKEVGGDFYDIFELASGKICISIGDISGKGVSAALFMMMVRSIIREKIIDGVKLSDAIIEANTEIYNSNPESMFATVFVLMIDPENGEIEFANAGHNPPILINNDATEIKTDPGIAVGIFDDAEIVENKIVLSDNEGIFIYTDGVTEAINKENEQFGVRRTSEAIIEGYRSEGNKSEKVLESVIKANAAFSENLEQFDDCTCIALFYHKRNDEFIYLKPELSEFGEIKDKLFEIISDDNRAKSIILCCEEVFVNIVSYSGAKKVGYWIEEKEDAYFVAFIDDGVEFDPTLKKGIDKEFEELDSGGMGIEMIRNMTKSMKYERRDEQNILSLLFEK